MTAGGGAGAGAGEGGWEARREGEGPRRAQKNDTARKISIFALHKLMTMSSFLINSNYIEPKFPPFEEFAPHGGPGGGDGGVGGGPGYPRPQSSPHLPAPNPHAARQTPAYYAPRAREPSYPGGLYPAPAAACPYACRGASPARPEQSPAPGAHPSPAPQPPAPPRRCAPGPTTPAVATGGSAPACPLLLADQGPAGPKGKEPVVYPWMKKIHVSAGMWRRPEGSGRGGAGQGAGGDPHLAGALAVGVCAPPSAWS